MATMVLPSLAAATSSGHSFADWAYDVSKSVASAVIVAFGIAAAGKGIGWGPFARIQWRTILIALLIGGFFGIGPVYLFARGELSLQDAFFGAVFAVVLACLMWVDRESWLKPSTLVTSSFLDSNEARRRGHSERR